MSAKSHDPLEIAAVRAARGTHALDECAAFYADVLGLPLIASFDDHAGYDGRVFGLPGKHRQLELVRAPSGVASVPNAEDAIVLYIATTAAFAAVSDRIEASGRAFVELDNPYWAKVGARAVLDPDGWTVILVPPGLDH